MRKPKPFTATLPSSGDRFDCRYIRGAEEVTNALEDIAISLANGHRPKLVGIDIETYPKRKFKEDKDGGLLCVKSKIRTLQMYSGESVIILDFLAEGGGYLLTHPDIVQNLSILLHTPKIKLAAHNASFELNHLQNVFLAHGIDKQMNVYCTQTAFLMVIHATKLNPKRYHGSLKEVAKMVLGVELDKEEQVSDWSIPQLTESQLQYCALDAILPVLLLEKLGQNLEDLGMTDLFKLTTAAQDVTASINVHGHAIDAKLHAKLTAEWKEKQEEYAKKCFYLLNEGKGEIGHDELKELLTAKITKKFKEKIWECCAFLEGRPRLDTFAEERDSFMVAARALEEKVAPVVAEHAVAGVPRRNFPTRLKKKLQYIVALKRFSRNIEDYLVDPNSGKQISDWLRANVDSETIAEWPISEKSGQLKTDAEAFADHDYIEVIKPLAQFKRYAKLYSTYGVGWQKRLVDHGDRTCIHPNYSVGRTETGRMSSYSPNIQNPPRDKSFREMFIARNANYRLLVADFNQIELRVLAYLSQDPVMIRVYEDGGDLHGATAALSGKTEAQVGEEEWAQIRQSAKSINFCKIFGGGAKTIQGYAKKVYKVILPLEHFEDFSQTFDETYCGAYEWRMEHTRECERTLTVRTPLGKVRRLDKDTYYTVCLNTPIQGGACEVLMLAMVHIHKALRKSKVDARFVNVVHDEVIIECHVDDIEEVSGYIKTGMEWGMLAVFPEATLRNLASVGVGQNWAQAKGK